MGRALWKKRKGVTEDSEQSNMQWASRKVQVVFVCTTKERPKAERQEAIKDMNVYTRTRKKKPTGCKD